MKKKILFTAGGSPGQEAIFQQLSGQYDLYFADKNIRNICSSIPISRKISIPVAEAKDFFSEILKFCLNYNIDLLVPGVDEELLIILENQDSFSNTKVFLPSIDFVELMLDKEKMNKVFDLNGLSVPKSTSLEKVNSEICFPVIMKPTNGRGSRNVFTVDNLKKLRNMLCAFEDDGFRWLIQEKEVGDEYTVQVLSTPSSDLLGILPIKVFEKRGSTIFAKMHHDEKIIEYCREIHRVFKPGGCYNVQLIKTAEGKLSCFEINPRISTTFCMAIEAGIDPFKYYLDVESTELKIPRELLNVPTILLNRYWNNQFEVK
jgi:carbamoyl-phosphate synthase large subunit